MNQFLLIVASPASCARVICAAAMAFNAGKAVMAAQDDGAPPGVPVNSKP